MEGDGVSPSTAGLVVSHHDNGSESDDVVPTQADPEHDISVEIEGDEKKKISRTTSVTASSPCATRDNVGEDVLRGPDLNESKTPLDSKLYRQILLPNGLRAVLIQDTIAMHQNSRYELGGSDEEEDDNDIDDATADQATPASTRLHHSRHGRSATESDDDSDVDDNDDDDTGLRDAAASILVGVGSMYDPVTCQGLAHFLEHLLFMGSEKYPGENEYESFVAKHGGTDNAWTEWEYTTYTVSIPQEYLWGAMDRLAQFFVAPLLLESAVDRELNSIESEFQLNKNSDSCRWQQLLCATSRPDHPMAKFSWGNLRSLREIPQALGVDPLVELRRFYNQYYYAANMRVCVIGAYTLDEMEQRVQSMFAKVPALPRTPGPLALPLNPETGLCSWQAEYHSPLREVGCPLAEHALQKIFRIVPVKDKHALSITWPFPGQMDQWRTKPGDFLAHLLGHEASGSLLSYFRSQSWATSCMAGVGEEGSERASSHALFNMSFALSKEGLEHWRDMVAAVYEYIGMLRFKSEHGWPEWIFDELRSIHEVSYRYGDEASPEDIVEAMTESMAPHYRLPPERLLDGPHLLFGFDAAAISSLLDCMTPQNARIDLTSSSFGRPADFGVVIAEDSTDTLVTDLQIADEMELFDASVAGPPQIEPMFGTFFWCSDVPSDWIVDWCSLARPQEPTLRIGLPPRNPFVPEKFDLKPLPSDDARHPLLNSSLKLCIAVGKSKQWFPATVVQYNEKKNALLLSYEDEDEQWHVLDRHIETFPPDQITPDFEGTMDEKKVKYRIVALAQPGMGPLRKFADDSDFAAENGTAFPPIPPALPPSRLPKQICNSNLLKMWYLQDRSFHRPIAELRLEIICGKANSSPLHKACAELLVELCVDNCLEMTYLASVCELGSLLVATDVGFYLRFHGFDNKLSDLFERCIIVFLSFRQEVDTLPSGIDGSRFRACLEVLRRRYRNQDMSASHLAGNLRLRALRPSIWSANKKLHSIKDLCVPLFAKTVSEVLADFATECLLHGNIDLSDADRTKKMIISLVGNAGGKGLPRKKYPAQSMIRIPSVDKPVSLIAPSKDPGEPNTAVEVYVQVNKDNLHERVLIDLLVHIIDEPIYDQIRTKDQFGYDVHCDIRWSYGIMGIVFKIVTNVKSASAAVERIDKFLSDFRVDLETMSAAEFLEHLVGLSTQKLDMFNSLSEQCDHYWCEIRDGRFEWEAYRDEAICLRSVQKGDLLKAFDKWLNPASHRNVIAIQVIGTGEGDVSIGRPFLESDKVDDYLDAVSSDFHILCKAQTWGRVNSKLF